MIRQWRGPSKPRLSHAITRAKAAPVRAHCINAQEIELARAPEGWNARAPRSPRSNCVGFYLIVTILGTANGSYLADQQLRLSHASFFLGANPLPSDDRAIGSLEDWTPAEAVSG